MSALRAIPGLSAEGYVRHALHAEERIWLEKNCYIDVWIELLHALDLEPRAMLGTAAAANFVGDQWTFLKPPHAALWTLYGIEVQELTVWKPLIEHAREHLAAGRLIGTEADAWWLPDTSGTDYRRQHTKSSIIIESLDAAAGRLGYFHNAGYYSLDAEDYARLFRLGADPDSAFMPLYAEWIDIARRRALAGPELAAIAHAELRMHVARMPAANPITAWANHYLAQAPQIHVRGVHWYHMWAFANTRQLGAAMELLQLHLQWLQEISGSPAGSASDAAGRLAAACKTFILKGARSAATGRTTGLAEHLGDMAQDWEQLRADLLRITAGPAQDR